MRIEYLADHPQYLLPVARWLLEEWLGPPPRDSLEFRVSRLRERMGRRRVPCAFVAISDDGPLGNACLVAHDMDTRPDLTPWLASVLVNPAHRGQGVGKALVRRVEEEAAALGFNRLYLFTWDKESFYARLGWNEVERVMYRDRPATVMDKELIPDN